MANVSMSTQNKKWEEEGYARTLSEAKAMQKIAKKAPSRKPATRRKSK